MTLNPLRGGGPKTDCLFGVRGMAIRVNLELSAKCRAILNVREGRTTRLAIANRVILHSCVKKANMTSRWFITEP